MLSLSSCKMVNIYVILIVGSVLLDLFNLHRVRNSVTVPMSGIVKKLLITFIIVGILSFIMYKYCNTVAGNVLGAVGIAAALFMLYKSITGFMSVNKLLAGKFM